jgi:AGCS family alanine or glycine:cation symporter
MTFSAIAVSIANGIYNFVFFSIPISAHTKIPLIVIWLIIAALFFTFYFGFINIRGVKHSVDLIRGKYDKPDDPGLINHFQALATALSGTIGIGNIGGVAIAIAMGGPGAAFWLFLAGFFAMSTRFIECALAVKYRTFFSNGVIGGGPMYYLSNGLRELNLPRIGKFLAIIYAFFLVFACIGVGNMFQANQSFVELVKATGGSNSFFWGKGWLFGLFIASLTGSVIIGGIKSIAKVTTKLVPFMGILYFIGAVAILIYNHSALPYAINKIFHQALTGSGISGGMVGVMIIALQRALFSNEAGVGAGSIAYSAVRTKHPVTEGFIGMLGPFFDTMVVCMLTALVIVTTMYYEPNFAHGHQGVEITSMAFERRISWSPYLLSLAVFLFAFSTLISWSYYGLKAWGYCIGEGKKRALIFKLAFCCFAFIGCLINIKEIVKFSDAFLFLCCVPNIIGLYVLAPLVKKELKSNLIFQKK